MHPVAASPRLQTMVTTLKIVVGAVVLGLLVFLGIGAWMHLGPGGAERPAYASFFTWVAVAWGLTQPVMFWIVRLAMTRQAVLAYDDDDVEPFRSKYLAAIIVAAAGVEAAGLFAAVAYLLEGRIMALVAGGICAVAILAAMPTSDRVNNLLARRP